jgi:predicted GTPase
MATNIKKATKEGNYSEHLRLVILGKTGNGKSATANSLVGSKVFKSSANSAFVTENCEAIEFEAFGKKVLLVDTPGIGDLIREQDFILNELKTVMEYAYPGPHAFLIILSCQHRFTRDEKESIELISSFFGLQRKRMYSNSTEFNTKLNLDISLITKFGINESIFFFTKSFLQ